MMTIQFALKRMDQQDRQDVGIVRCALLVGQPSKQAIILVEQAMHNARPLGVSILFAGFRDGIHL
jgi:hypothetical protein